MLDFLAYLEFERGLSRNTLDAYRSDLLQFGEWLRRTGRDPLALDETGLAEFVAELALGRDGKAPAKPATLQRKVACLRSFHRNLRRQGMIEDDPTALLASMADTRRSARKRPYCRRSERYASSVLRDSPRSNSR